MSKFSLFNKFMVQEGEKEKMVDILLEAAESMKNLDECEIYLVNISENEPNSVYVYEVWANEDAHQASLGHEATQTLISRAKPIITGIDRINTLITQGGKGISSN
ncbi:antibiotic biosynthesis monooxygenase [Bacillus safensis]|uniref:putative quinol monooxygenase n=1 Tax=Bacillus TaxID=1386 RepID=UPI00057FFDD7|nr:MULTISPECIES: antibiotic biosynthesis monooxygenase [Bacillus]MBW4854481.1 antibiotic biosynthesis monooxygenase [Bacillaceae bacterium]AIZ61493.1 antibiotic biosynthesis monooxygenase [Bacillus sp. WP8]KMK69950.1 antibiotic biosynthesis monooxygenase [Bacillus safensis]KUF24424.1 antibiotic biosynthesis monooxygenase [Bacillus sp. G1(2015b)]KUR61796.1 antibiotic biosynthesis monooxygenase [Bacillus sp. AM 13(2015)]